MERLTKRKALDDKEINIVDGDVCYDTWAVPKKFAGPAIDRLSSYEDTGLEADTVSKIRDIILDIHGDIGHLRELVQAEKDGRLVVLPCKIGDTVYMSIGRFGITGYEEDKCDGFHIARDGILQIKAKCYTGNHGAYGVPGKTAFLTREEAEAALEKEAHNG